MTGAPIQPANVGDTVEVVGHKVGESARQGKIAEVLGEAGHIHYRVEWGDGRESLLYPGGDVHFTHAEAKGKTKTAAKR
jgi:hypothetical protein